MKPRVTRAERRAWAAAMAAYLRSAPSEAGLRIVLKTLASPPPTQEVLDV